MYRLTRHNAGFLVIDAVAVELGLSLRRRLFRGYEQAQSKHPDGAAIALVKPLTYMNRSGEVLPALLRRLRISPEQMAVVCDQIDLPPGTVRIKRGGSNAGHRGLHSISHSLGEDRFVRIYVGIGRPASRAEVVDHVLSAPEGAEQQRFEAGIARAAAAVLRLFDSPLEEVMSEFNQRGTDSR